MLWIKLRQQGEDKAVLATATEGGSALKTGVVEDRPEGKVVGRQVFCPWPWLLSGKATARGQKSAFKRWFYCSRL